MKTATTTGTTPVASTSDNTTTTTDPPKGWRDVEANWPPLSIARKARLKKVLNQLSSVRFELIDLAKPAPRRGRPPKVSAA
jgi:hypothetical protein